jgi:myo-inositol-1(or 4)-monophosphatase
VSSSPVLSVMINAVRKAARGVQRDYGEVSSLQVSMKGPGDFVTASDKKAERVLRSELAKARPTYGFLGEEEGPTKGQDPDHRFIIDPIDGTTNFMHALPFFAVTVALERKGEIVSGVTYDPISDELFHAEKGIGAFLNNKRMRVSFRKNLHEALVATNIPHMGQKTQLANRNEIAILQARSAGIRALGSTALELAYVACGRLDAAWCHELNAWDMAAGLLFIRESGGLVAPLEGYGDPLHSGGYIAANGELLPQIQMALAEAKKL